MRVPPPSATVCHRNAASHTRDNALLLDMRDARAFCREHDPRAVHLSDLNLRTMLKLTPRSTHILICCYHGHSSRDMGQLFSDFGFDHCYSIDGGYDAWNRPYASEVVRRAAEQFAH